MKLCYPSLSTRPMPVWLFFMLSLIALGLLLSRKLYGWPKSTHVIYIEFDDNFERWWECDCGFAIHRYLLRINLLFSIIILIKGHSLQTPSNSIFPFLWLSSIAWDKHLPRARETLFNSLNQILRYPVLLLLGWSENLIASQVWSWTAIRFSMDRGKVTVYTSVTKCHMKKLFWCGGSSFLRHIIA